MKEALRLLQVGKTVDPFSKPAYPVLGRSPGREMGCLQKKKKKPCFLSIYNKITYFTISYQG